MNLLRCPSVYWLMAAILCTARAETPRQRTLAEGRMVGLWMMGQSLCDGSESLPIVTPTDTGWGNLAFRRGVRTWVYGSHMAEPEKRPAEDFSFVPLSAAASGGLGETIANGMADHLKATLLEREPAQARGVAPHFLVAYAGQGGRTIEELSVADEATDPRTPAEKRQGGGYYRTSLDDARRALAGAKAEGKSFSIAALVWMQGEGNGGPTGGIRPSRWAEEIPPPAGQEWYRDRLIAYRQRWSDDLRAITGQAGEIPFFTYQTLGPAGEAQLMAADLDPHITLVGPHYMVPSAVNSRRAGNYGAAIHLSADGERWFGEQVAKVIRRTVLDGEDWQPLRPRKAWVGAGRASVTIEFAVPRPPLVLEAAFLPRQQVEGGTGFASLYGFHVRNAAGQRAVLAGAEIEGPTKLRLNLAAPLDADHTWTVSYGLPHAGQVGTIAAHREGPLTGSEPTTELLIDGDLRQRLQPLLDEGAFFVANTLSGEAYAQTPIRAVYLEGNATILRFEKRELRNKVEFAAGQSLVAMRPFSYGNLRDSDPEKAIYRFADSEYGRRAGQTYPL